MVKESSTTIRVAQISTGFVEIPNSISLNIYAQGCRINCPNCQNKELQKFDGGTLIDYCDIKTSIENHSLCNWICWLGGDATFQPNSFKKINSLISNDFPRLKICLYTGRLFDDISALLDDVDLVIDGPWNGIPVIDKNTNQRIFYKADKIWNHIPNWEKLKELMKN